MLSKEQIKYLKKIAQNYKAVIQIGKNGLNDGTLQVVNDNLTKNELTKIRILNNAELTAREISEELAEKTDSELVQLIGHIVILYRKNEEKEIINLPK